MRTLSIAALAALLLSLVGPVAHAEGQSEQAKTRFRRGVDFYEQGNFRAALAEFERAYELAPSGKLFFNIGQVDMELLDSAAAMRSFTRYLREEGSAVPPSRREQVLQDIERLRARVGLVTIDAAPGSEVLVDDVSVGFAPLPDPVPLNVGRRRVTISLRGHNPTTKVLDVAVQQQLTIAVPYEKAAEPVSLVATRGAVEPPSMVGRNLAWVSTGVLAVTASVFAGLSFKAAADLKSLKGTYPVTPEQLTVGAQKVTSMAIPADVLGIAAVVAGGVALYLTVAGPTAPEPAGKVSVSFGLGPGGASVVGTF